MQKKENVLHIMVLSNYMTLNQEHTGIHVILTKILVYGSCIDP